MSVRVARIGEHPDRVAIRGHLQIWQDKVLTCEDTEQVLVLELKNTIVIGQGGIPGKGTWKLKDSTGFDPAPRGKDEIVVVESERGG